MDKVNNFVTLSGLRDLPLEQAVTRQVKAFCEEAQEFYAAMARGDKLEMLDGLADMRFVSETLYSLESYSIGVDSSNFMGAFVDAQKMSGLDFNDVEIAFSRVEDNNLDKFDSTPEGAHATLSYYRGEGYPVMQAHRNGYWVTTLIGDYNGQFAGKVLKRFGFVGVDLKDLV
jgi:hypothetical protein